MTRLPTPAGFRALRDLASSTTGGSENGIEASGYSGAAESTEHIIGTVGPSGFGSGRRVCYVVHHGAADRSGVAHTALLELVGHQLLEDDAQLVDRKTLGLEPSGLQRDTQRAARLDLAEPGAALEALGGEVDERAAE